MRRREFITLVGSAAAWPLTARAQQADRMRRIVMVMPLAADDPISKSDGAAFLQRLQELGWIDGHNVQIEKRWGAANASEFRKYVADLLALTPDVILAVGSPSVGYCWRPHMRCRSSSCGSLIPWALDSSIIWRDPAGTLPGLHYPNQH
jgi:putative ABC transport system substrate-binding protein